MRDIRCRGLVIEEYRSIKKGEWVYGSLLVIPESVTGKTKAFIELWHEEHKGWQRYQVDPKTVGQYTGLKDKNGKDIYEGDIVISKTAYLSIYEEEPEIYQIAFKNGCFCFVKNEAAQKQWNDGNNYWYSIENVEMYETEIIGSIHQNKELLDA